MLEETMILTHRERNATPSAFWVGVTIIFIMGVGLFMTGCADKSNAAETYGNELDTSVHMINLLNQETPISEEHMPGISDAINAEVEKTPIPAEQ